MVFHKFSVSSMFTMGANVAYQCHACSSFLGSLHRNQVNQGLYKSPRGAWNIPMCVFESRSVYDLN